MGLIVQKFGGSSVADLDLMQIVAAKVAETVAAGHQVVVVVSAMHGETDRLIKLAKAINNSPSPREMDALLATGEQLSTALLAICLINRGISACSYTGAQVPIYTDDAHNKARILSIDTKNIRRDLAAGKVAVVAGFQGINEHGDVTTLGRGGSDTTAVALAAALQADECQIYTDVKGVYTTDPRIEPKARLLDKITINEMLEMASLGAKVLQSRSVELAGRHNVPVRVLSTLEEGKGTLVVLGDSHGANLLVSGIAFNKDEAKIILSGLSLQENHLMRLLPLLSNANIEVDMLVQNHIQGGDSQEITFTTHKNDFEKALNLVQNHFGHDNRVNITGSDQVAKLSLIGVGLRSHANISGRIMLALAQENIDVQLITTSEIKVSILIAENLLENGVRTLHAAFQLDGNPDQEYMRAAAQ
jgi:aspartate kinase